MGRDDWDQEFMMKTLHIKRAFWGGLLLLLLLGTACRPAAETAAPTSPLAPAPAGPTVSATGRVVPAQEALLSVAAGGVIEAVLVAPGAAVPAGQVLLQLEGRAQQAAAVAAAEWALAQAVYARRQLDEDPALQAAQALRAAETAEQALADLAQTEPQEAQAHQAVAVAARRLEAAEKALTTLTKVPPPAARAQADDNLLLAAHKLNQTLAEIADVAGQLKKYAGVTPVAKQLRQALKGLEIVRTQDQLAYNRAQTKVADLQTPPDPTDLAVAEAELRTAQAALEQAQRDLERVLAGPEAGAVAVLTAQRAQGQRDYAIYQNGPDPDEVALADAQVAHAETQLAAAQARLADLELVAPFAGVIAEVYVQPREWLAPGSPVLLLADLDHLQIETTDLGEIEVAQIHTGETAIVTFDALPELELTGTVLRIAPKAEAGTGVNYPVILVLSESPPALRWGMTAFVDIEVE